MFFCKIRKVQRPFIHLCIELTVQNYSISIGPMLRTISEKEKIKESINPLSPTSVKQNMHLE